jgi:hypothetical protein
VEAVVTEEAPTEEAPEASAEVSNEAPTEEANDAKPTAE